MSKLFVMRSTQTGSEKVAEAKNGGLPPQNDAVFVGPIGWMIGTECYARTKAEKSQFSRWLHGKGYVSVGTGLEGPDGLRVTSYAHENGSSFEVTHLPVATGYRGHIKRIS